jgi:hypothetical protein
LPRLRLPPVDICRYLPAIDDFRRGQPSARRDVAARSQRPNHGT